MTTSVSVPSAALNAEYPPGSNTGGNYPDQSPDTPLALVDTLTFTLALEHLTSDLAAVVFHDGDAVGAAVDRAFLGLLGLSMGEATGRRLNGYRDSAPIVSPVDADSNGESNYGFVAWGGNLTRLGQDTVCVHLTGQACESINLMDDRPDRRKGDGAWSRLYLGLLEHGAKVTRLDVAHDDLTGAAGGIEAAVAAYHAGAFTLRRPPSVSNAGDWINGRSRTLYVGKRENGKLLRIYEKGHQLGAVDSPWVRYELELHSVDRVIPLDAILDPAGILAGGSPFMADLLASVEPTPVRTLVRQRLRVTMDHLTHYARVAYGRLVNAMTGTGMTPAEIVRALRVDGLPARLYVPPAACGG